MNLKTGLNGATGTEAEEKQGANKEEERKVSFRTPLSISSNILNFE